MSSTESIYTRQFFADQSDIAVRSAEVVVPILLELLGGIGSVIDIGCGSADWLSVFARHGSEELLGVDAEHVPAELLRIPADRFQIHDLRRPLAIDRHFELAMSVEVAEHLPLEAGLRLVGELARLAPVVLFSAAIPFQVGTGHINCQWQDHWARAFAEHGMRAVDPIRDRVWGDPEVAYWYAQNLVLYASEEALASSPDARRVGGRRSGAARARAPAGLPRARRPRADVDALDARPAAAGRAARAPAGAGGLPRPARLNGRPAPRRPRYAGRRAQATSPTRILRGASRRCSNPRP